MYMSDNLYVVAERSNGAVPHHLIRWDGLPPYSLLQELTKVGQHTLQWLLAGHLSRDGLAIDNIEWDASVRYSLLSNAAKGVVPITLQI
jgi:hypothetical protein